MSWNLRDVTVLWRFNARSDGNLDVMVLLRRRSEGGMNNFVREDASVIKERVARGGHVLPKRRSTECVKLSLADLRRASRELKIPKPTVRKILQKQLQLYLYKLQLVQKLQPDDPIKRLAFCEDLLSRMETDRGLSERVIFSGEATFFLSGKVNRHNTRICGSQNPHALIEMER